MLPDKSICYGSIDCHEQRDVITDTDSKSTEGPSQDGGFDARAMRTDGRQSSMVVLARSTLDWLEYENGEPRIG